MRFPRLTHALSALLATNVASVGVAGAAIIGLSGCSTIQPGARTLRAAYCAGVSNGGRAALAVIATGQADTVIRCDNVPGVTVQAVDLRGPVEPEPEAKASPEPTPY